MKRWGINVLAVLSGVLMAVALRQPWWSLDLQFTGKSVVFPNIIVGPVIEIIGYRKTAQMTILTYLLLACIVVCLVASLLRGRIGRLLLGVSGVLPMLAIWRFYSRIADVAERFDMPVQGRGIANYSGFSPLEVTTKLESGIYLMAAGAVLCLLAAILHERVRLRLG